MKKIKQPNCNFNIAEILLTELSKYIPLEKFFVKKDFKERIELFTIHPDENGLNRNDILFLSNNNVLSLDYYLFEIQLIDYEFLKFLNTIRNDYFISILFWHNGYPLEFSEITKVMLNNIKLNEVKYL